MLEIIRAKKFDIKRYICKQGCAVGILTRLYKRDGHGHIPERGKTFYCTSKCPNWLWGTPRPLFNAYRYSFPGRVDHSPLSSAEVKNKQSYTSAPPIRLHS
jgi:hypothetical protein